MAKSSGSNCPKRKRSTGAFLAALFVVVAHAEVQPIALDRVGGSLYVLNADGSVVTLAKGAKDFRVVFNLPGDVTASDIVSAETAGNVELVVVSRSKSGPGGRVFKYSLEGRLEKVWLLPFTPLNADIDPRSNVLYMSGGASGEIYQMDLNRQAETAPLNPFLKLPDVGNLGPVVFIQFNSHLLVADIFKGTLYDVDVKKRRFTEVSERLGQVTGMAIDPSGRILAIVDSATNRVLLMSLATHLLLTTSTFAELSQITSVAFGYDGTLWIGDYGSKAVFVVSPTGPVLSRIGQPTVQAVIPVADHNLRMIVDGQEMLSWAAAGPTPKAIPLAVGVHSVELQVYNQRSFTGGIEFLGGHVPEGWRYQFRVINADGRDIISLADGEERPEKDGPRFGKEFTVARFSLKVALSGSVSVQNLDSKAWQH